jgi:hypothetical protein
MIYALFIWVSGAVIVVDTFPTMLDCKVHEAQIQKSNPGAQTNCVLMEEKFRV